MPEESGLRGVVWRYLLDLLPEERSKWEAHLKQQRELYRSFLEDLAHTPEALGLTGENTLAQPNKALGTEPLLAAPSPGVGAAPRSDPGKETEEAAGFKVGDGDSEAVKRKAEEPSSTNLMRPAAAAMAFDDPLSLEPSSKWASFHEDRSLLNEIHKDVIRTHPDLQVNAPTHQRDSPAPAAS